MNVLDRGAAAHKAGQFEEAERLYRETVACAWQNLAVVNIATRDFAGAERHFRSALEACPGHADAEYGLSLLLLSLGRYAEAWPLHEARRRTARVKMPASPRTVPEWGGEPLAGTRLLVIGEQGFGDQIQFARFLSGIEAAGAEATFACAPELASLIPGSAATIDARGFDFWCYACSLPLWLGVRLDNVPPPLRLDGGGGGGGVGVVARGRPTHFNDAHRSLDTESARTLLALGRDLHPDATGARTFAETADIVRGLDLVITVDTSVAHLAASMGKPTWVLLPRHHVDWRWGEAGEGTPWYPTARLFRQSEPGDWAGVLAQVARALASGRVAAST